MRRTPSRRRPPAPAPRPLPTDDSGAQSCNTENAVSIASLGVQIHGGMGFIEETGAAQHLRDARITTIYEGTTGVQATTCRSQSGT